MKHNINTMRGITLIAVGAILCFGAGSAQCQRSGRGGSRSSAAQAGGSQRSANQMSGGCSNGSSSSSGSTSATTAQSSSSTAAYAQNSSIGIYAQSNQAAGAVSAQRTASNQLAIQYTGSTANVQRVYLGIMDANGNVITQRAVTQSPVQTNLALTNSAKYYGVQVVYSNGTSKTMYSPIR